MTVELHLGDCLKVMKTIPAGSVDAVVTDPPYGIAYESGQYSVLPRSIVGDDSTAVRDAALAMWDGPALVFGTWRAPRPIGTKMVLVWDTLGALGMGDLSLPWKPSHQEVYVLGSGFSGRRDSDVLRCAPVQSMAKNGRCHPHEKPVGLMKMLLAKCPPGTILDPFMGSGTTGVACVQTGRNFIGIEIDPGYFAIAKKRIEEAQLQMRMEI
jgi:DNA modification methylase